MLGSLAETAAGHELWKHILQAVADIDGQSGLTGQQKHDAVLEDLKSVTKDLIVPIANLLIEIAVIFIQGKDPFLAPLVQAVGTNLQGAISEAAK